MTREELQRLKDLASTVTAEECEQIFKRAAAELDIGVEIIRRLFTATDPESVEFEAKVVEHAITRLPGTVLDEPEVVGQTITGMAELWDGKVRLTLSNGATITFGGQYDPCVGYDVNAPLVIQKGEAT